MRLNGETFVQDGKAYLFPAEHTTIHFFNQGHRPFEGGAAGRSPPFLAARVSANTTVVELIAQLGYPKDAEGANDRFGITECVEVGGGEWKKGTTYVVSQERSKKTLKTIGWEGRTVWVAPYDASKHFP